VEAVEETRRMGLTRAGKQAHVWALMPEEKPAKIVALEAFYYVISHVHEGQSANTLARGIGTRAEYALWLMHKEWGHSLHLKGLRLAGGSSLSMDTMLRRLKDKGFKKAIHYKPLEPIAKTALGMLFLELIASSTGLIELHIKTGSRGRRKKWVSMSEVYWRYLENWRDLTEWLRPLRLPMLVPPKPWTGHADGGYLLLESQVTPVPWERWPDIIKQAKPCVLGSINALQEVPYVIDVEVRDLVQHVWDVGLSIGSVPKRDRLPEPIDEEYKRRGLGPKAYWKAYWKYKADQRRNGSRSQLMTSFVTHRRIGEPERLHYVVRMDHRGRLYTRGAQLNPQGPDHFRAQLQFRQTSPMKGHESAFAWSIGDAWGEPKEEKCRINFLHDNKDVIAAAGRSPEDHLDLFDRAKESFRFAQLCMDWASYMDNPEYRTGTIHWLDQSCSGWGHVACLTGDHDLAQFTNIIGTRPADLYLGIGRVVEERIRWALKHEVLTDMQRAGLEWWEQHEIPRSLWKACLMPVIYGQRFNSLAETINTYLRDDIEDFLTEQGLRLLDLSKQLAMKVSDVIKDCFPNVRDLSRWLGQVADIQMQHGVRPYWYTPNMLKVESYSNITYNTIYKLWIANRKVVVSQREQEKSNFNRLRTKAKLVPDFVHSHDAAFLQRFVMHWQAYKHPICVVHDCFGTTLEHLTTLRAELGDQWARFYSVDYLSRHQGMVECVTGKRVPDPPIRGTLDRTRVGENPYLFC
jgi:DNA-directed RNA polymerase